MSDLWKAKEFLGKHGYEFVWESPDCREVVWRKGDIDVSLDETREWADITVPLSDLPSFLSRFALEDVEKAIEETHAEVGSWENAECRIGAFIALDNLTKRLRQQTGGGQGVNEVERRLREIEEQLMKAKPPYDLIPCDDPYCDRAFIGIAGDIDNDCGGFRREDAELMTQAPENLRFLLSLLREREEENRQLREALGWLVHLNRGVSKGGGQPTPTEWEDAWQNAERMIGLKIREVEG